MGLCQQAPVSGKGKQEKDETSPLPKALPLPKTRQHQNVIMTATSKPKVLATRNWLDIPSDLMMNILQRINAIEILLNVQRVCTNWRQICKDPCMWRVIYLDYDTRIKHWPCTWESSKQFSYMVKHEICANVVDRSQGQLVDITIVGYFDEWLLQYVADRSIQLRRLKIKPVKCLIFFNELTYVLKKCPLLEELSLHNTRILKAARTLGRDFPMLKTLKLSNVSGFEDDVLELAIAENLPGLRHLKLKRYKLTNTGLRAILDKCRHLQVLDLKECYPVNITEDLEIRCLQQIKCVKFTHRSS